MTRILDVYLDHAHVGTLTQNQGGQIVFAQGQIMKTFETNR
jgi:hypothetical protein